jgi:hypothetical protein
MDEFYEFFKGFIRSPVLWRIRSFVKFVVILKPCIEQPDIEYLLLRQSLKVSQVIHQLSEPRKPLEPILNFHKELQT